MFSSLKSLFSLTTLLPQIVTGLFGWLNKKEDTTVVQSNNAATATGALVQAETARSHDVKDIALAMMDHPVFWCAWGLGVFPVLLYHACIFFVSTFPSLGWTVLKVPAEEIEYGKTVVANVFMLTGASTVVSALAHAWIKRT
jgi:hypothetical protein